MEGPYRDLGSGFARLTGAEGARRSPSRIRTVEDALLEFLRNAQDAGAKNIYVATTLHKRRYRTLTVLDDGHGIPAQYKDRILEPGVTSRHLSPAGAAPGVHHAGLSLYHISASALSLEVLSTANPTSLQATFDTRTFPERTLQSNSRPSRSNLQATLQNFLATLDGPGPPSGYPAHRPNLYYGSLATILATLIKNRIIHSAKTGSVVEEAGKVGIGVSLRTVQRVLRGEIKPAPGVGNSLPGGRSFAGKKPDEKRERLGVEIPLGSREISEITAILRRAARAGYVEVGELRIESRPGEITLKARVFEPEEEYE